MTRGDIEDIRGVTVSRRSFAYLKNGAGLMLSATVIPPDAPPCWRLRKNFLDDLGLRSVTELPPLDMMNPTLDFGDAQ